MSKHPIVHVEFSSRDREESGKFYSELFGWKVRQIPEMNYATFEAEGGTGGGFNPINEGNPAGTISVYVNTDDIDATLTKAQALGGKLKAPKQEIPGVGWFAFFTDLSGNTVALLQPFDRQP
jgi:uncharacterized protein